MIDIIETLYYIEVEISFALALHRNISVLKLRRRKGYTLNNDPPTR